MNAIAIKNENPIVGFSDEQWALVKKTILESGETRFTDDEFRLFVNQAKRTGLDPFSRQIYATKIQGKMTVQATIDGLRLVAQRSGKYAGQTRPTWFDKEGKEYKVWTKKEFPYACEVGVLRHDFKEPLYAMAIFDEYAAQTSKGLGFMWKKMPALMIAKVAEALAIRRAFPNDLSGIYSQEEIFVEQAEPLALETTTPPPPQKLDIPEESEHEIAINKMLRLFSDLGVSQKMIKETYNVTDFMDLTEIQMDDLRLAYKSLASKEKSVTDIFKVKNHAPKKGEVKNGN